MLGRSLAATGLSAALLVGLGAAPATPEDLDNTPQQTAAPTYRFTQQHRDNLSFWNNTWAPATVPEGARIEVQLPGDPVRWVPDLGPECRPSEVADTVPTDVLPLRSRVEQRGALRKLPNEGRIPGSSAIYAVEFQLHGIGLAAVCLRPDSSVTDPGVLGLPAGSPTGYVLTLVVGVPQGNV
jgi:hypothetical protein